MLVYFGTHNIKVAAGDIRNVLGEEVKGAKMQRKMFWHCTFCYISGYISKHPLSGCGVCARGENIFQRIFIRHTN